MMRDIIFSKTLLLEGGYSDDKSDPGGATAYGISSKYNPKVAQQIKEGTFTKKEALKIYNEYYERLNMSDALSTALQFYIFDVYFSGQKVALAALQSTAASIEMKDFKVDGVFGPSTERLLISLNLPNSVRTLLELTRTQCGMMAYILNSNIAASNRRAGRPYKDYYNGMYNRCNRRFEIALDLLKEL